MLKNLVYKYAIQRSVIPKPTKTKFVDSSGEIERDAITIRHLAEAILDAYGDGTWIFFDTETSGLDNSLPEAQVTEISAYAVDFGRFETETIPGMDGKDYNDKILKPVFVGNFHRQINLSEHSHANLDNKLRNSSATVRQILHFNGYDFDAYQKYTGRTVPEAPGDFKPLTKFNPENLNTEIGPRVELQPATEMPGSFDEKEAFHDFLSWVSMVKGKSKKVTFAAHKSDFDWKFVMRHCRQLHLPVGPLKDMRTFDTLSFNRVFIDPLRSIATHGEFFRRLESLSKGKISFKLDFINQAFGILDPKNSHRAFKDVENTVKMIGKLVVMLKHMGEYTPGDLDTPLKKNEHPLETEHVKSTDVTEGIYSSLAGWERLKDKESQVRLNKLKQKKRDRYRKVLQRVRDGLDAKRNPEGT